MLHPAILAKLARREPFREKKKAILISLEDTKSAKFYFEAIRDELKGERLVIIAKHRGTDPKNVIEAAKDETEKRKALVAQDMEDDFEAVWIVFDTEGTQHIVRQRQARNAIQQALALGFKTAVSNPCFEYWLLLHFEWCVEPFNNAKEVCHRLKKYIPDYNKSSNCYAITKPYLHVARKHAERVFQERHGFSNQHPCDCLPCTEIHYLVEKLLD